MNKDRLATLFELQKELQLLIHNVELPEKHPELIPLHVTGLIAEIGEVLNVNKKWKTWREQTDESDEYLLEEIVDAFKFLTNITLFCGFDADDIYRVSVEKDKENHRRQEEDK